MFLAGIADEAGASIERQIEAHRELGWRYIEIRNVDEKNLIDVDEAKFNQIAEKLDEAGIRVCCLASQIANWARKISGDFTLDVEELKRAIPRMHRLGTKYIRIMSYPNDNWSKSDWRKEAVKRLKKLARIAEDGQVILIHENCEGWGGQGPEEALDIIKAVNSPNLRFLLDTGNKPHGSGSPWDICQKVRDYILHVHIKEYKGKEADQFVFPGEGDCQVEKIIEDLLSSGYKGGFSIEPHMASVIHLGKKAEDSEAAYRLYLEYGRKAQALVEKATKS